MDLKTREAIKKIREINDRHLEKTRTQKKHLIVTYGCQMNILRLI